VRAPDAATAELHHLAFRAMQRLQAIETCGDRLRQRPLTAEIHREIESLIQTSRRRGSRRIPAKVSEMTVAGHPNRIC